MKLKVVLDRIENDKAVLVAEAQEKSYIISLELLPKKAKEGDVLTISTSIDNKATEQRKEEVSSLIDKLSGKDNDQTK